MLNGGVSTLGVVEHNSPSVEVRQDPVHQDNRQASPHEAHEVGVCCTFGRDEQAIHLPGLEGPEARGLFRRVLIAIAQNDRVAMRLSDVFDASRNGGEEGIANIRHDQSDAVRALERQRTSGSVGLIVELLHGSQDSGTQVV